MIEFNQLTVLIFTEILVALLVISGLLVYFALLRKGRISKAAQHLAERVQNDGPQRNERLKHRLAEHYGYGGAELEQTLHNIIQSEMLLYQNIINGSLKDDQLFIQQVDVDVENLVLAYQNLQIQQVAPVTPAVSDEEATEMQRLQEENERLSDELRVTMDTMGRMLNEYSTMFAGGHSDMPVLKKSSTANLNAPAEPADDELFVTPASDQALVDEVDLSAVTQDIDIPPYQADNSDFSKLDDESGLMDDEVSEIIDEVMGMADEQNQVEPQPKQPEEKERSVSESMMDELDQVDIDIPDMENDPLAADDVASGSLEDEWAKLLEEDAAASKSDKNPKE